jgi:hypothetical protein
MKIYFFTILLSCFFTPIIAQNTLIKIEHVYPSSANQMIQLTPYKTSINNFNPVVAYPNSAIEMPTDTITQDSFYLFKRKTKTPVTYPKTSNIIRF